MDVGASQTNITIDNRTTSVTYSITMVALSPHLPSPVIGPVSVILGETVASPLTVLLNFLGKNDHNNLTDAILTKLRMDLILKIVCGVSCFKGQVLFWQQILCCVGVDSNICHINEIALKVFSKVWIAHSRKH